MQVNVSVLRNLVVAGALVWLCAACQGAGRLGASEAGSERAGRQSRQGDHAAAASSYEAASRSAPVDGRNAIWLAAATEWLSANDAGAADNAIGMLAPPISTADARERVRIEAEIAVSRGDTQRAVALMREIPAAGDAAALATRARIQFNTNHVPDAVSSLIARDRLLPDAAGREANQRLILDGQLDGHTIRLETRRFDHSQFLLLTRGFNWIQERPLNK